jgi:hypothetical protein
MASIFPNSETCETPNRPYIVGRNDSKKQAVLWQPRCGLWTCPYCAAQNTLYWSARAAEGIQAFFDADQPARFLTVTSAGTVTPTHSVLRFKLAWPKLRKALARRSPGKFEYLLIPERQKSGRLHAHFACNAPVSSHALHDLAWRSGMGYQAKAEQIKTPQGAAWYTAKYLAKQIAGTSWPARFHRVRHSNGWPELPERKALDQYAYTVYTSRDSAWLEYHALLEMGYKALDRTDSM